jgi:2-keto-4-pentenoate hydratase/2-oxohepta-3-ene-1,7-dioic acid hydratase in catechol pathway
LRGGGEVVIPNSAALIGALESLEPGLGYKMNTDFAQLPSLLDYEVELAFVLLQDIKLEQINDNQFVPKLGFTILNDFSARSLILLGEGRENRYEYWGLSKSFSGFTPIADTLWVPNTHYPNSIPCITLRTTVNDILRQEQTTKEMIYTPLEMLRFVAEQYPDQSLSKGDVVAMGTPGGVIMSVPRWKVRLSAMLNLGRFTKLQAVVGQTEFLKSGDVIVTSGEGLNKAEVMLKKDKRGK